MIRFVIVGVALFGFLAHAFGEDRFAAAQAAERSKDPAKALVLYREFVRACIDTKALPGQSARFVSALRRIAALDDEPAAFIAWVGGLELSALDPPGLGECQALLAECNERIGKLVDAALWYERASGPGRDPVRDQDRRLRAARLFFESGYFRRSWDLATKVLETRPSDRIALLATCLKADLLLVTGNAEAGIALLREIRRTRYSPLYHLLLHDLHALAGNAVAAAEQATILARDYPESPERQILSGRPAGRFTRMLSPSYLLGLSLERPDNETKTVEETESGKTKKVAEAMTVQIGSFTSPENAEWMVKDLARAGFPATIREKTVGARHYYRVLLAATMSEESAQNELTRLGEKGFAGVMVPAGD